MLRTRTSGQRRAPSSRLSIFGGSDFRIVSKIGEGGFGQVYKCSVAPECDIDENYVAIKVLQNSSGTDPQHEANIHRRLDHKNIVKIFGVVPMRSGIGIVMELIDGGTLRDVLNRPRYISAARALDYSRQLADGIDYLHNQARMVHGDLKPENVLLTKSNEVKITDFGIAARVPGSRVPTSTHLTVHLHGGTKSYLAPEFRPDMQANPAIDMYGFGVIMAELVEKVVPSEQHSAAARRVTEASEYCYRRDPRRRPTSAQVLEFLRQ